MDPETTGDALDQGDRHEEKAGRTEAQHATNGSSNGQESKESQQPQGAATGPGNGQPAEVGELPTRRTPGKKPKKGKNSAVEILPAAKVTLKPSRAIAISALDNQPDREEPEKEEGNEEPTPFEELVASIRTFGILQPVLVRWDDLQKSFAVLAGRRRVEAAKAAGLSEVPCVEIEGAENLATEKLVALVENRMRLAERPIDQARKLQACVEAGLSRAEIMEETGMSAGTVSEYLSALKLPAEWLSRIEAGADLTRTVREYKAWQKARKKAKEEGQEQPEFKDWKQTHRTQKPAEPSSNGDPAAGDDAQAQGETNQQENGGKPGVKATRLHKHREYREPDTKLTFCVFGDKKEPRIENLIRSVEKFLHSLQQEAEARKHGA